MKVRTSYIIKGKKMKNQIYSIIMLSALGLSSTAFGKECECIDQKEDGCYSYKTSDWKMRHAGGLVAYTDDRRYKSDGVRLKLERVYKDGRICTLQIVRNGKLDNWNKKFLPTSLDFSDYFKDCIFKNTYQHKRKEGGFILAASAECGNVEKVKSTEKKYDIDIPENVVTMWAAYQRISDRSCSYVDDLENGMKPSKFIEIFSRIYNNLDNLPGWILVVTATDKNEGLWPHGKIKISGFHTVSGVKYYCNNGEVAKGASFVKK